MTLRLSRSCSILSAAAGNEPNAPAWLAAITMAGVVPTAMVFVPCEDGISHNEVENADPVHLAAGCQVLCDVMLAQAGVVAQD